MTQIVHCDRTVSLHWALIFGADGACVSMSLWSVLAALLVFAGGVGVLQIAARRLLAGLRRSPSAPEPPDVAQLPSGGVPRRPYDGGPIRSARPR